MTGSFIGRFRNTDRVSRIGDGENDPQPTKVCEPVSDAEIARMSAEEYRSYIETGKRPAQAHVYDPNELPPDLQSQTTGMTPQIKKEFETSGTYKPGIQGPTPEERFARASDARHGYRSSTPAPARDAKTLTPEQRFAEASARRHAPNPHGRAEAIRRRRSE